MRQARVVFLEQPTKATVLFVAVCVYCFKSHQLKNATLEWKVNVSLTQMLISLKTIDKYAQVRTGGYSLFSVAFC